VSLNDLDHNDEGDTTHIELSAKLLRRFHREAIDGIDLVTTTPSLDGA
jgi:hypothetical protein